MDPRIALVPPVGPSEDFSDSLRWKAGPLLGGLDWLLEQLIHRSAIAMLIEPIVGDWAGLERGAAAWRNAGEATVSVATNFTGMATGIDGCWAGAAADAFTSRADSIADSFTQYADGCRAMGDVTDALVDLCKATAEAIAGILGFIGDYLTRMLIEASIPVAGWITGAVDGVVSGALLAGKIERGVRLIQRVVAFIERFREVLMVIQRLAAIISFMAKQMASASNIHAVSVGGSAARTSFGVS